MTDSREERRRIILLWVFGLALLIISLGLLLLAALEFRIFVQVTLGSWTLGILVYAALRIHESCALRMRIREERSRMSLPQATAVTCKQDKRRIE